MGNDTNIQGRVFDAAGEPVESVVVVAREQPDREPIGRWITGDGGEFAGVTDGGVDPEPASLSYSVRNPMRGGTEETVIGVESGGNEGVEITVSTVNATVHGGVDHRGMNDAAQRRGVVVSHRFHTQFPELRTYDRSEPFLRDLGGAEEAEDGLEGPMVESADDPVGDGEPPAAYGIFGQFIDHDITFDPTSDIDRRNDPAALRNFRTPALDLDSVYRTGAEVSPFLYDHHHPGEAHLLTGEAVAPDPDEDGFSGLSGLPGTDLQRNEQGVALIGDPRNDENVLISQLHLAFLNFHNRVVDHLSTAEGAELVEDDETTLQAAQRLVTWHYQWTVRHDFLPRVCDRHILEDIENRGRQFFVPEGTTPSIPVEFSGAAYRFGHSMIRHEFDINDEVGNVPLFPTMMSDGPNLRGGRPVPSHLTVEWSRLLEEGDGEYQPARKIVPFLAPALFRLPMPGDDSLAVRNLRRGVALGLPSGQDVARRMGIDPIGNPEFGHGSPIMGALRDHGCGADPDAPLWYYILDEARYQQDGERLGAVGSRIVAETIIGLIEADDDAYPNAAPDGWEPSLPQLTPTEGYTLADLVAFAEEGTPDGLVIEAIDPGPGAAVDGDPLDESVTLSNHGSEGIDLSGYVIDLGGGQRDGLPDLALDPSASLTIHIGSGTDTDTEYYLGRERAALNDAGDTVTILDPDGEVSTRRVYTQ